MNKNLKSLDSTLVATAGTWPAYATDHQTDSLLLLEDQRCWWGRHTQALRAAKLLILCTRRTRWARKNNVWSKQWQKPQFALGRNLQVFMHFIRSCFWLLRESGKTTYHLAKYCDEEASEPCSCSLPVFQSIITCGIKDFKGLLQLSLLPHSVT